MFKIHKKQFDTGDGNIIEIETGKLAKQADGAVTVQLGETIVVVAAVAATNPPNSATDGLLQSLSIDSNGLIQGSYSGLQIPFPIGYLAIANFPNPGALQPIGNTDFAASGGSGDVALSAGGSPGTGTVMSGSLEASNVDMTNELVQMIKAQQLYNGNARALQTQVEVASRVTDKL